MKKIDIGFSGLRASAIGLGCMRIGELTQTELAVLVDTALDAGIDLFDHADIYGGGACEESFGRLLATKPLLRQKIFLQSKCGVRQGYYDLSKPYILDSVDGILRRLNTDYLDLFLLHRPDSLMEPEEIAEAFEVLYKAGKVRFFGVSNINPAQMELLQAHTVYKLVANQMQFSLARSGLVDSGIQANVPSPACSRDASVLEYCRLKKITIQAWSPLQYGWFEGVFLGNEKYPKLNEKLNELAEKYGAKNMGRIPPRWLWRGSCATPPACR